jgi:glycosyltransferase involved in cell wall biosynthesis
MGRNETQSQAQTLTGKSTRPAIIVSAHMLAEYSIFLEHLLVGLADESVPTALVCPTRTSVDSVVSGTADIIRDSTIDLPLARHLNGSILIEQLDKFRPSILHCLCETKASLVRWIARQLDLPYTLMVSSLRKPWTRLSISLDRCVRVIVPAATIAANFKHLHPHFADRIIQINVGTFTGDDIVCFSEPSHLTSIVIAHPLKSVTDFQNVFSAARRLIIDGYEFLLAVMGEGLAEGKLWKLLSELNLSQSVTIIPRLQPWRSVVASGDIFIQPQPVYRFNPMLLEAMSVGAAIAACKGGVDDLIIPERTAVVFNPEDEVSVRAALQNLLDRRESARQLARQAQQYVRENHSVSEMVSATLQVFRETQTCSTSMTFS